MSIFTFIRIIFHTHIIQTTHTHSHTHEHTPGISSLLDGSGGDGDPVSEYAHTYVPGIWSIIDGSGGEGEPVSEYAGGGVSVRRKSP